MEFLSEWERVIGGMMLTGVIIDLLIMGVGIFFLYFCVTRGFKNTFKKLLKG